MNAEYPRGSEWRRWDLHLHTKGTNKNDQFNASADFDAYCKTLFQKALDCNIAAIGITDYFSIENYRKVVEFVSKIDELEDFDDEQKQRIKDILIIPNVELRMLPVTDSGRLVNIHCLFDPLYVSHLDNDFFGSIEYSSSGRKFKMNRDGLISLGKYLDNNLDDATAYKKGVDNFVVSHGDLQTALANNSALSENTIVAVSNSNNDGASAFQQHYDFFEATDPGSLEALRKSIYCLSQVVFSSNDGDRRYFLGLKNDDEDVVKSKCGSLKPCVHGSDAHTENKLFAPDQDRFCWIKADVTFEGLKQVIYEPADRVFIGLEPPVLERVRTNKTKYIDSLEINQSAGYHEEQGVWFKEVHIDFNKELIAIIGNKGSGKSALSDIVGVLGNTHNAGFKQENLSFLNARTLKFRKRGYAENFNAELVWQDKSGKGVAVPLNTDVDTDQAEKIKYLPQNYFENLTNDLEGEGFDQTLKSVIFLHLPEEQRLESHKFGELEDLKAQSIEKDLADLRAEVHEISSEIIKLEAKKHPSFRKQVESSIAEKQKELDEHEKIKPTEVADPSKSADATADEAKKQQYAELEALNKRYEEVIGQIAAKRGELNRLSKEKEELVQLTDSLTRLEGQFEAYKAEHKGEFQKYGLNIDDVVKSSFDKDLIATKVKAKSVKMDNVSKALRAKASIDTDASLSGQTEKTTEAYKQSLLVTQIELQEKINDIKKVLSQPEKDFQEYKEKLAKWEKKKNEIEGPSIQLNTLNFFKNEKNYLDNSLMSDLSAKRKDRLNKALEIFRKKKEIIELYRVFKKSIDDEIAKDEEFTKKFKMEIDVNFRLDSDFSTTFLQYINKTRRGTFLGASDKDVSELFVERDLLDDQDISDLLDTFIERLENDQRENDTTQQSREIGDQIEKVQGFYDFVFSLEYLKPIYELKLDGKILDELSPGEKGTLLLVFYLMIDKEDTPLVIDQPEDNLDNKSVFQVLTHFMKTAKKRRQIIIVTHNPNLAVGADAEQIIYVELDKKDGRNVFSYETGAIENPKINARLVEILEGTMPAFDKRKLRYKGPAVTN
jgi:ABC-type lipoprotein export system ATPase subunit